MNAAEQWLVALCDPAGLGEVPAAGGLSDDEFLRLRSEADRHGVLPAFLNNLGRAFPAAAEKVMGGGGGERLAHVTATSLFLSGMARKLLAAFKKGKIPALVIKGPVVAARAYRPQSLRSFIDIDVLVPKEAWGSAREVLVASGYATVPQQMKHAEGYGEEGWMHQDHPGCSVELHWNLVNSPTIRRGVSVAFEDLGVKDAGLGVEALSPAALLLIAAVHGAASHSFDKLQHLCDIVQLARGMAGPVDAQALSEMIQRTGAGLCMHAGLSLAEEAFPQGACADLRSGLGLEKHGTASRSLSLRTVLQGQSGDMASGIRRRVFREALKRRRP